jgi:HD-GYP domain-containing protein (c-di-GMP phosphodiesterase class II)
MSERRHVGQALVAGALALPIVAILILNQAPSLDVLWMQPKFHFYVVSGTALAAAVICAVLVTSARALRETRLVFLVLAFLSIAAIFATHGLMTPGFIHHEPYPALGVSTWLSVLAGAVFIALSAADLPKPVDDFVQRRGSAIAAVNAIALTAYIVCSLWVKESEWLSWIPLDTRNQEFAFTTVTLGLLAFGAWRYFQAYSFARLPSQAAMVAALVLLIDVQVALAWGRLWHVSFWIYHASYAIAFVVLFAGWALEVRRAGSVKVISEALSMRDALAQLNRGRPDSLVELADAIEAKDAATLGHVSRVASYALAIGRDLGLPAGDLRSLVLAAQMHDVGKISTPDAILSKPGKLTDEEYHVVKQHAARGDEIAAKVDALRPIRNVIRHHHERVDGGGYPDGLKGDDIPLLSRIISVADTYDALTSMRPYRPAAEEDTARIELQRIAGSQLDKRCVDALLHELERPESAVHEHEKAA